MAVTWTTQRTGNWSLDSTNASSPWYDGGTQTGYARTPGSSSNANNDLVVIANGHTLTCDASVTIGDATTPASFALRTAGSSGTGILSVSAGVTLTIVSNVQHAATWTFAAGSGLTFNSSTILTWQVSDGNNQANAKLRFQGSSGSHCTVTSSGAAKGKFTYLGTLASHDHTYTDFTNIGDSSNAAIQYNLAGSNNGTFSLDHCTFTTCGPVTTLTSMTAASVFSATNNTFTSSAGTYTLAWHGGTTALSGGTRLVQNNAFDKSAGNSLSPKDFTIKGNYFGGSFAPLASTSTNDYAWAELSGNLFVCTRSDGQPNFAQNGSTSELNTWNYAHMHSSSGQITNQKLTLQNQNKGVNHHGYVVDPGNCNSTGDIHNMTNNTTSAMAFSLKYNLILPVATGTAVGKHVGELASITWNATTAATIAIEHNTYKTEVGTESGAPQYGETNDGVAGMITSIKFNLAWSDLSNEAVVFHRRSRASSASDGASAANITYNGKWNPSAAQAAGGNVAGYRDDVSSPANPMFSTDSPGANDVTVTSSPFADVNMSTPYWRNIATWAVAIGQAVAGDTYQTKVNAAYTYLKADPETRIAALVTWVKNGWKVTASTLKNAGQDGVTIGALDWTSTGSAAPLIAMISGRAC